MQEERDILGILKNNPNISQRKISEKTGLSLGQVNFLIKKFVKKGLIKIEGQTSKSIKYNLTPKGFAEKAALTQEYIKLSYKAVIALTEKIRSLADQFSSHGETIFVYGDNDEMMEIVKIALGDRMTPISETSVVEQGMVVFYWGEEDGKDIGGKWINILE